MIVVHPGRAYIHGQGLNQRGCSELLLEAQTFNSRRVEPATAAGEQHDCALANNRRFEPNAVISDVQDFIEAQAPLVCEVVVIHPAHGVRTWVATRRPGKRDFEDRIFSDALNDGGSDLT